MNHHVVHEIFRQVVELVVEVQVALGAAAAPPGLLVLDGDSFEGDAHLLRIKGRLLFELLLDQPAFGCGQVGIGFGARAGPFVCALLLGSSLPEDPVFVLGQEADDFPVWKPFRHPGDDFPASFDLKPQGPPFGADDLDGYGFVVLL